MTRLAYALPANGLGRVAPGVRFPRGHPAATFDRSSRDHDPDVALFEPGHHGSGGTRVRDQGTDTVDAALVAKGQIVGDR